MSQSSDSVARPILSQRIVYVDSYTTFPIPEVDLLYSQFRGTEIKRVPVIRIYGATTTGHKACAHIHGVFPYLYVEHDPKIFNLEQRLALELDQEINSTLKEFNSSKDAEHIYKVLQVTGRSFYGYQFKSQTFLKIFFYSPIALSKSIGILQAGKIVGRRFHPYEAHIPYILQFFMDFKLYGMNLIHFENVKFRGRVENSGLVDQLQILIEGNQFLELSELPHQYFVPAKVTKKTRCEVEFDVVASDIIFNRSSGKNPGIEAIWLDEKERRRQRGILDLAEVTIPISQDRPFDAFLFKREEELLSILKSQLKAHLEESIVNSKAFAMSPKGNECNPLHVQELTPSSQVLIEDIEMVNLESPLQSQFQRQIKHELEWNEEDEEMVALLDELAKNRVIDEEEEDSIISSQVLADFQEDPYFSFSTEGPLTALFREQPKPKSPTETEGGEVNWEDDFFSTSICQFLDECETNASGVAKSQLQASLSSNSKDSGGGFMIDQSDGQFDSSGDEVIVNTTTKDLNAEVNVDGINSCIKGNVISNISNNSQTQVTFVRNSSSSSLTSSPSRSKIRPPSPPSPEIISSDDDAVSLEVMAKQRKGQSAPQIQSLPIIRSLTTSPLLSLKRSRSQQPSSEILEGVSSDDDEMMVKPNEQKDPKLAIITSPSPTKVLTNSNSISPSRSRIRPPTPPSPEIIDSSSGRGDGDDSDETQFDPSDSDEKQRAIVDLQEKPILEAMVPSTVSYPIMDEEVDDVQHHSQEGVDSGIRSFYRYGGDTAFPRHIQDLNSQDDNMEASPGSQSLSIHSVYEYSDNEGNNAEGMDLNFQDVCMSPHNSQITCSSSSESQESSLSQGESKSNFMRQAARSRLKLKQERESYLELKERLCPSIFPYEVTPLKNPPSKSDIEKWVKNKSKVFNLRKCRRSEGEDDGPVSLKYFRNKLDDANKGKHCENRKKMIRDILFLKAEIEGTLAPSMTMLKCTASTSTVAAPTSAAVLTVVTPTSAAVLTAVTPTLSASSMGFGNSGRSAAVNHRVPIQISFSDSDSDDAPSYSKLYRFGGALSDGEDFNSSEEVSDCDTLIESSIATPLPPSSKITATPKSAGWIARKRRKLNSKSQEQSQGIKVSFDESELDSISFTSSQSPVQTSQLNSSNFQDVKALHERQFLTTMSMEVHCSTRGSLIPDPTEDALEAIFYFLHQDTIDKKVKSDFSNFGYLMVEHQERDGLNHPPQLIIQHSVKIFSDELSMIKDFIRLVHEMDPDILVGYEICRFSWGYLIDRGRQLGLDMISELSRLLPLPKFTSGVRDLRKDEIWNESISGRIVFNLWRLLRHEMTVTSYTFENAVFQILHERVHLFSYKILTDHWTTLNQKVKVISYFQRRVTTVVRIIEKLDLINRTSELARLFGIQFFEVLSRGSQFRVESMMLRLAKVDNLIPPSPIPQQRAYMKAPEYLPLIMEPESKFYSDPVAVLDFQSLYPSMMIAYNYCFSTCIGRVQHLGQEDSFEFGCMSQEIPPDELSSMLLQDLVHISPCGVVFVKESVKKGVLGEMLEQILDTRQMVKRSMKKWKNDSTLQKVLDSRQLGLKLIANVTYGYTSANYSGRMPCVEIADSVVSKGRETLQRAIDFVKENEETFHAKVVYGDTDSLFLHFPGKSRREAFALSQRVVEEVTAMNPKPVKLKLEKVYQPCILQTKKRYVGYAYETVDQDQPKYDAKGIETVRRDGCPATAKILEGALKVLFVTQEEPKVKEFVSEQFRKIFMGSVSLSKYTFAREYRGRGGYKPTAVVPSLEIAKRLAEKDPRAEPLRSQRVPYIVVYGNPNVPLIQLIKRPDEFIENPNLRINAHYYIEKAIIPPLSRCFSLAKMDVSKWYAEMPRKYLKSHYVDGEGRKCTIDQYFLSESCIKCESRTRTGFCESCFSNAGQVRDFLNQEENRITKKFQNCCKICTDCSKEENNLCLNMDCAVKHRFLRYDRDYKTRLPKLESLSHKLNLAMSFW